MTELEQAKIHLSYDPILKNVIDNTELNNITPSKKFFHDLLESITSQQLSIKAADTIYNRFKSLLPADFTPEDVFALAHEQMRSAGLSNAKSTYIHAIAHEIVVNKMDTNDLYQLPDEQVIERLTKIKGIGKWTAEMTLIFALARPDVFSVGDLGLRTAIEKLYGIERTEIKRISELSHSWKPYRSYASRYLWKSLKNS